MRFTFRISKLANKFFFISNLSEWHFSCRKDDNQKWLAETGPLSQEEKAALKELGKIMRRYGFTYEGDVPKYLGRFFYLYPQHRSWGELRRNVSQAEYRKIKEVFSIFNQRFEKVWRAVDRKEKERRVTAIQSALNLKKNRKVVACLDSFFRGAKLKNITVVILFSPQGPGETTAGGANISDNAVTLEVPALRNNTIEMDISIGILFHEIVHVLMKRSNGLTLIQNVIRALVLPHRIAKDCLMSTTEMVSELAVGALAPYGYLMQRYYGVRFAHEIFSDKNLEFMTNAYREFTKKKVRNPYLLIKYFAWQFYPTVSRYMTSRLAFGEHFIKLVAAPLKRAPKGTLSELRRRRAAL